MNKVVLGGFCSLFLIVFSSVSCEREKEIKTHTVSIRASISEDVVPSKTSIDKDGKMFWTDDDDFYVYSINDIIGGDSPSNFESEIDSPVSSAVFTGNLEIDENETYFALYPGYNHESSFWGDEADGSMNGEFIGYLSPDQYDLYDSEGNFDFSKNMMLAAISEGSVEKMLFQNTMSGLKFSVSEPGITAIKFRGNNGEYVAGSFSMDYCLDDDGVNRPVVTPIEEDAVKEVSLGGFNGLFTGEWLYLVVFPQTFEKGITITFEQNGVSFKSLVIDRPITFNRSIWKKASDIDLRAIDLVPFKDPEVKSICVEHWDTDGDGEISIEEAAAVTSLTTAFRESAITSFDELSYFTSLTSLPVEAFKNCRQLKSIALPACLTLIQKSAFVNCDSMEEIVIPESVKILGEYAFDSCEKLASVIFEGTLAENGIGKHCFSSCSSLSSIVIPEGPTTIPYLCFYNCGGLKYIDFPSTVTNIDIILEDGILSDFAVEYFIVRSTIPPNVSYNPQTYVFFTPQSQSILVFVPEESLDAYKNDSKWKKFSKSGVSHIYSIDQMESILLNQS